MAIIECYIQEGKSRTKRDTASFCDGEANVWVDKLAKTSIPVISQGFDVLDGEYIELFLAGDSSNLKIFWHSVPPSGCEVLGDFVDWLVLKSGIGKYLPEFQ